MSLFDDLQGQHAALLLRQQNNEDVLAEVKEYIQAARAAGRQVADVHQREQLRANLRFWAGYVFDKEGAYPQTDLEAGLSAAWAYAEAGPPPPARPVAGAARLGPRAASTVVSEPMPAASAASRTARPVGIALVVVLGLIGLCVAGTVVLPMLLGPSRTPTSQTGATQPTPSPLAVITSTPRPTPVPATPEPPFTAEPTFTPEAASTAEPLGIIVQFENIRSGDPVRPQMTVTGSYQNLQAGWSIHVLLQPISSQGRYFPAPDYFRVRDPAQAGEWSIPVAFGDRTALGQPEQYIVTAGIALSDSAREALAESPAAGLDALPSDFFLLPQSSVVVDRAAYEVVDGERLLYSRAGDLYLAEPDGANSRLWIESSPLTFAGASLSPSGQRIALVGQEAGAQSLWLMDSDGGNRTLIAQGTGAAYERPLWSQDGRFITYSATVPTTTEPAPDSAIYVFEIATGETTVMPTGRRSSRYPSWTPDGKTLVFSAFGPTFTLGLFTLDLATGQTELLLDTQAEETQPVVSPDGAWVAYLGYPEAGAEGNRDIYLLDLTDLSTRQLTKHGALDWRPQWAPDSQRIYFESSRAGSDQSIWAVDLDGRQTLVREAAGVDLAWPYVGRVLAFATTER